MAGSTVKGCRDDCVSVCCRRRDRVWGLFSLIKAFVVVGDGEVVVNSVHGI